MKAYSVTIERSFFLLPANPMIIEINFDADSEAQLFEKIAGYLKTFFGHGFDRILTNVKQITEINPKTGVVVRIIPPNEIFYSFPSTA